MKCDFCNLPIKDVIYETKYWRVFPAYSQAYLGRCIILLNRHCGDLAELKPEEWEDFANLIKKLESSLKKSFGAKMFNWSCLMNKAYKSTPPNPHVHWHFRPRYDRKVMFEGMPFEDPEFGQHYNKGREKEIPEEVRRKIAQAIRENIRIRP